MSDSTTDLRTPTVKHEAEVVSDDEMSNIDVTNPNPEGYSSDGGIYDDLRKALSSDPDVKAFDVPVPARPGVALIFDPNIEWDTFEGWMKAATNRKTKKMNARLFADIVIANTNIGVKMNGQEVSDNNGKPLTLISREFQGYLKSNNARDAIKKLFALDGHIISVMGQIVDEAGYGERLDLDAEDVELDPFTG